MVRVALISKVNSMNDQLKSLVNGVVQTGSSPDKQRKQYDIVHIMNGHWLVQEIGYWCGANWEQP